MSDTISKTLRINTENKNKGRQRKWVKTKDDGKNNEEEKEEA